MRQVFTTLLIGTSCLGFASNTWADESEPTESTLPALKVLPVGSSLHNLRVPRFDQSYTKTALFTAKKMDILAEHTMKGTGVDITLFKQGTPQGETHLNSVFYHEPSGIIHSVENLTISNGNFDIAAQGLILKLENRAGFLLGKTQTLFYSDRDEKMTTPASIPLNKKSLPTVKSTNKVTNLALAAAAIPSLLTAEELKQLDTLAAPSTALVQQVDQQTQDNIQNIADATKALENDKQALQAQLDTTIGEHLQPSEEAKPLKQRENQTPISVTSDDGAYYDATQGQLVYLKNVVVTHPQYSLSCSNELKVILKEKEQQDSSDTKHVEYTGLDKVVATGNVVIKAKNKDGKLIVTHSEVASYNATTGAIILKGGKPSVQQDGTIARVLSDSGYIEILPNMSVRIKGEHEFKSNLKELQKNK